MKRLKKHFLILNLVLCALFSFFSLHPSLCGPFDVDVESNGSLAGGKPAPQEEMNVESLKGKGVKAFIDRADEIYEGNKDRNLFDKIMLAGLSEVKNANDVYALAALTQVSRRNELIREGLKLIKPNLADCFLLLKITNKKMNSIDDEIIGYGMKQSKTASDVIKLAAYINYSGNYEPLMTIGAASLKGNFLELAKLAKGSSNTYCSKAWKSKILIDNGLPYVKKLDDILVLAKGAPDSASQAKILEAGVKFVKTGADASKLAKGADSYFLAAKIYIKALLNTQGGKDFKFGLTGIR